MIIQGWWIYETKQYIRVEITPRSVFAVEIGEINGNSITLTKNVGYPHPVIVDLCLDEKLEKNRNTRL